MRPERSGSTPAAQPGRSVAGCRHRQFWRPADALQALL